MTTQVLTARSTHRTGLKLTQALAATALLWLAAPVASTAKPVIEQSLYKVCAAEVPALIERATSNYLLAITAMGGDAKPLCGLWNEIDPNSEDPILLWKAVSGSVLLHTLSTQKSAGAYQAAIATAIDLNPKRRINTKPLAMVNVYVNVRENAAFGGYTPRDLAYKLQDRIPDIAATLRKAFDKWEPPD